MFAALLVASALASDHISQSHNETMMEMGMLCKQQADGELKCDKVEEHDPDSEMQAFLDGVNVFFGIPTGVLGVVGVVSLILYFINSNAIELTVAVGSLGLMIPVGVIWYFFYEFTSSGDVSFHSGDGASKSEKDDEPIFHDGCYRKSKRSSCIDKQHSDTGPLICKDGPNGERVCDYLHG